MRTAATDDRVGTRVSGSRWNFTLFQDDGKTYAYEKGGGLVTKFVWDDAAHQLKHEGGIGRISLW